MGGSCEAAVVRVAPVVCAREGAAPNKVPRAKQLADNRQAFIPRAVFRPELTVSFSDVNSTCAIDSKLPSAVRFISARPNQLHAYAFRCTGERGVSYRENKSGSTRSGRFGF